MAISHVIMDFDGTCTGIPAIYQQFLARYLSELNASMFTANPISQDEWLASQQFIREHSPQAAWTIASSPTAPAAADPYILASECAKLLLRRRGITADVPSTVFVNAQKDNPAPWRNEARDVFEQLLSNNIRITFTSNTSSQTITQRIQTLFATADLPQGVFVKSGAQKYKIEELVPDSQIPAELQALFRTLPVATEVNIGRPVYLRRGSYFEAICAALGNDLSKMSDVVFCGDIWEMDLAMPYALGANIQLIAREKPFDTYPYEAEETLRDPARGRVSSDLNGLLQWIQ